MLYLSRAIFKDRGATRYIYESIISKAAYRRTKFCAWLGVPRALGEMLFCVTGASGNSNKLAPLTPQHRLPCPHHYFILARC